MTQAKSSLEHIMTCQKSDFGSMTNDHHVISCDKARGIETP